MAFLLDTSPLFKRYQPEKGTEAVCRIIEDKSHPVFISSLTIIEIISNLKRLYDVDKITNEEQFHLQRSFFYQDLNNFEITILDITADDIIKADELILKKYMKPVDSIQLAVALNLPPDNITFVCADQNLCNTAKTEGLSVLNLERTI